MENQTSTPKWYLVMAIFFLLWNLMGVNTFFYYTFMSEQTLQALSEAERNLNNSYPFWVTIAFAVAVFGGLIGSIGLLVRKKWAKIAFTASLIGIIPQMTQNLFFSNAKEVHGPDTEVMSILVVVFGVFLLWFSVLAIKKNWLK